MDMGIEEEHPGDEHRPPGETPFEYQPSESAPSASDHPAVPSPTTTKLPATHPATSLPTTTPSMAAGLGFTGMPCPTYSSDSSRYCATYGNCSQRTSGIQLHLHRCS